MTALRQRIFPEDGAAAAPGVDGAPAVHEIRIHRSLDTVEPVWRRLEARSVMTPYQSFALLAAWVRHVAPAERVEPLVAVGHGSDGEPLVLLPFGLRRRSMLACVEYLGGEHANYNMPVFAIGAFARLGPADLFLMLDRLRAEAAPDLLDLERQPERWAGRENPFLLPGSQPSPSFAYSGALHLPFDDLYRLRVSKSTRAKDRKKLRHLEAAGGLRFFRAGTPEERRAVLAAFFAQKACRFAAKGIPNIFEEPGTHAFLEQACALAGGEPAIDLHACTLDGRPIATLGVSVAGGRASAMFNSIAGGAAEKDSPGIALMHAMIADAIGRGCTSLDFGVGEAAYKARFCVDTDPLRDGFLGVTAKGRLAAAAIGASLRIKRRIKAAPRLFALMEALRRRRSPAASAASEGGGAD
jgi:CelD/BcsL family acetyltransferase involved in cellulose biosynthesis